MAILGHNAAMHFFKRLHDRREPPGMELLLLRKLPKIVLVGTLLPIALSIIARIVPSVATDPAKRIMSIDIFAIAALITFWTIVLTVAIGCVIVYIMKGPAYVADPYPVEHADRPQRIEENH